MRATLLGQDNRWSCYSHQIGARSERSDMYVDCMWQLHPLRPKRDSTLNERAEGKGPPCYNRGHSALQQKHS